MCVVYTLNGGFYGYHMITDKTQTALTRHKQNWLYFSEEAKQSFGVHFLLRTVREEQIHRFTREILLTSFPSVDFAELTTGSLLIWRKLSNIVGWINDRQGLTLNWK